MNSLETNLRAFFEHYARTFHQDLEGFCDLYDFPSETIRLDGAVQRFHTRDAAAEFFALAKQKYETEGCAQWGIRGLVAEDRGSGRAAATIDWDMKSSNGMRIRGWKQTYELMGGPVHWKVQRSMLHPGSEVAYSALPYLAREALRCGGPGPRR
jgi:hypothetical protein